MEPPKLAAPGKGLPIPDRWILRIVAPFVSKRTPWEESSARFNRNSQKVIALLEHNGSVISEEILNQRVLVDPIKGLEDSSRFWSVGMTLDHMLITGAAFKHMVIELSNDRVPPIEVRVEKVKPPAVHHTAEIVERFKSVTQAQVAEIERAVGDRKSRATLAHPWFGEFTAHQWNWIMAVHQGIHLQQIQKIMKI